MPPNWPASCWRSAAALAIPAASTPAAKPAVSSPAASAAPVGDPAAPVTDAALRAASAGHTIRIGVTARNGSVRPETIALEEYVARVISGEGQPRAGHAALEALAVVIRTFAAANHTGIAPRATTCAIRPTAR